MNYKTNNYNRYVAVLIAGMTVGFLGLAWLVMNTRNQFSLNNFTSHSEGRLIRSHVRPDRSHEDLHRSLRNALIVSATTGNSETTAVMISTAIKTPTGVDYMKEFLGDESLPLDARKHAAEALIHFGTEDSVQCVLLVVTKEFELGNSEAGSAILSSLQIPVGIEGAKGLLNVLLGQTNSDHISYPIPVEVQSVIQKSLRNSSDADEIGKLMAQRYSELLGAGQLVYANELLDGVAHPAMIAELAAKAHDQGNADEVSDFFDLLVATSDPGVVGVLSRLASREPALLNNASEALFYWSTDHPHQAQPGLFAEYLNDATLPVEQRVVAAYGLAGLVGKENARTALVKAISAEADKYTQQCLKTALSSFENAVDAEAGSNLPTK